MKIIVIATTNIPMNELNTYLGRDWNLDENDIFEYKAINNSKAMTLVTEQPLNCIPEINTDIKPYERHNT